MADDVTSTAALSERVDVLAQVVDTLIGIVSRLDDETADTASANFDSSVPRVAGHAAAAADLKSLRDTLQATRKEWGAGVR
jgi:hypothetical protein